MTYSEAINAGIRHEMRRNPEIILLGQDIGPYGGTFGVYKGLFDEFGPDRVRDGPLCEPATCGFGIGGERLFSFLTGKPARETQIFPLMRPKIN